MKRRARDLLPKRVPGAFPSYLYKTLDDLEGPMAPEDAAPMDANIRRFHSKPLILLTNEEVDFVVRNGIGLRWTRTLALIRLRTDPTASGTVGSPGDILRNALRVAPRDWGELTLELEELADRIVPTLPATDEYAPLLKAYHTFKQQR